MRLRHDIMNENDGTRLGFPSTSALTWIAVAANANLITVTSERRPSDRIESVGRQFAKAYPAVWMCEKLQHQNSMKKSAKPQNQAYSTII